jgi:hypothetical protein
MHLHLVEKMVMFRSDDDQRQVYVLDVFCVYMGANLAIDGRVVPGTDCFQCTFHLWKVKRRLIEKKMVCIENAERKKIEKRKAKNICRTKKIEGKKCRIDEK